MAKYRFEQIAINCKEKKKPTEEDRFTYIGLEHLDTGSLNVTRFGSDVAPIGEKLIMRKGDVLFGKRRAYQKKVAVAPFDGIFSAHGMVLRPKEDVVDKNFFPLFISSDYFLDAAIKISVGSLSPTINWRDLKDLEFEMPDLHTQKKLAEVLWAINNAIESYKKLISATDGLVKSQFIEMFGNPVQNSMGWPLVKLEECLIRIDSGKSINCENYPRTGIHPAVLKLSAVTYGEYIPTENKQLPADSLFSPEVEVHAGDLLFSRKNTLEYVGMTVLVKETPCKLMLPDLIFRLVLQNNIRAEYLHQLINHPLYRTVISSLANGTTGSMPNISKQNLRGLVIPLPPVEVQKQIEPFVQQSDKSKFAVLSCLKHRLPLRFQDLETIRYLIDPSGRREFSQQLSQENYNG